jgi:hypothetical protein
MMTQRYEWQEVPIYISPICDYEGCPTTTWELVPVGTLNPNNPPKKSVNSEKWFTDFNERIEHLLEKL